MTALQSDGDIVLVVDDSPDTLTFMNEALEAAGFTVLVALEGQQAITIAKRIEPAIILLDAIMPNLDGFETCKRLKADGFTDTPIIFMTGLSDTDSIVKGLEAGGVDYLTKPINPDELIARIRVHLSTARRTSSAQSALDTTGHPLFTADEQGQILWATPGVKHLFATAKANDQWLINKLAPQLSQWFSHNPSNSHCLKLKKLSYPLEVQLVDNRNPQERLLKLIDSNQPSGAELLRLKLPVTERESEVLFWIANGKTNREIAEIIDMSPRTVNKHLEQIFRKLEVDNRTSAAAGAIRVLTQGG